MSSSVYVLQVGINAYPSHVGSLWGCVNDVENLHTYIMETFPNSAEVVQLLDRDARRENVIRQFREHLCRADRDDVALFHYCGHGARCRSAPEFGTFLPGGWDEGLVLIDSREDGGYDLADKELAILLCELARRGPHIAVLMDCCHSGSATRGGDDFTHLRARQTHSITDPRPLDSYLDGYYQTLLDNNRPLVLPTSQHILMAACDRKQKAWEGRDHQGVFTRSLLEVLRYPKQDLAYANVFTRCREAVRNCTDNQDPQFETYAGFKSYRGFLGQAAAQTSRRCHVIFDKGEWQLELGAVHGLPTAPDKVTTMDIFAAGESTTLGAARTVQVGAQQSEIELEGFKADPKSQYEAELTSMPSRPLIVALVSDAEKTEQINDLIAESEDQLREFDLVEGAESAKYALRVSGATWRVELQETEDLVLGAHGNTQKSAAYIFDALNHIAHWERTLQLRNESTRLNLDDVDYKLVEVVNEAEEVEIDQPDFTFNIQNEDEYFRGKLTATNTSNQELHFAMLSMGEDYSIEVPCNMPIEPTSKSFDFMFQPPGSEQESPLVYADVQNASRGEQLHVFKLLVSTERIDSHLLPIEGLEELGQIKEFPVMRGGGAEPRDLFFGAPPTRKITHKNDWFTKIITIRVVLQRGRVQEDQDVELAGGRVTIKAHSTLKAEVSLTSANSSARAVGQPSGFYRALEREGLRLLNFSTASGGESSILELSEIQGNEEELSSNPLQIELDIDLEDDEYILPVSFDGENMILVGEPAKQAGRTLINIDHIPDTPNSRRSLFKALQLYFFKCVQGETVNQLRWVRYDNGGVHRHCSGVAEKVNKATKVLVLIHGIIGDTKGIAEGIPQVSVNGKSLDQLFDVVLTYDYENLNTPIEITADVLRQQLADVGITENDGKQVTLLVHCMGGLVARWFIEKLAGDKIVDHLVMCGTPNNGSPFGQVGRARTMASMLGTLTISTFPAAAPCLGPLLYAVGKSAQLTPTLEQMKQGSPFMKALAGAADPGVPYSIVAGDVRGYDPVQDRWAGKLITNLGRGYLFSQLFEDQGHDIAVQVDSIRNIDDSRTPSPSKQTVTCHHMNYFVDQPGVEALSKVDW